MTFVASAACSAFGILPMRRAGSTFSSPDSTFCCKSGVSSSRARRCDTQAGVLPRRLATFPWDPWTPTNSFKAWA